jgi:hypothetical protein
MYKAIVTILAMILGIFAIAIASVVIGDGAELVANLAAYIMGLFEDVNLTTSHGISSSIKLIAIAWLVGWGIYRIRCARKK